jgi:hypothetical protein
MTDQTPAERLDGIRQRDTAAANDLLRTHTWDAIFDRRWLLGEVDRLAAEVEQLQVELGYALAPDNEDEFEPLTNRDVDPDAVYATEDDDYDDERAEGRA